MDKKERTGIQAANAVYMTNGTDGVLPVTRTLAYATMRTMRKDPTIALGRCFSMAPVLTSKWALQTAVDVPDEWVTFIQKHVMKYRLLLMESALASNVDFGWAPFEVVYKEADGLIGIAKIKPLLQDFTEILVDAGGSFVGFKQSNRNTGEEQYVRGAQALLVSFRVEGTMWYGRALIENTVDAYDCWLRANAGADRYDKKIAGSHFVVYYPPGQSINSTGEILDNGEIAKDILQALESSGSVAVPNVVLESIAELNEKELSPYTWRITILEDKGGRQASFVNRLKYLDTLKIRSLLMPERSMAEGSHGTLAEASAHIDLALTHMDFLHLAVSEAVTKGVIDTLLRLNWGEEAVGKVWIVPSSLVDERKTYLQKVYTTILQNSTTDDELKTVDMDAVKDILGIPKSAPVTQTGKGAGKSDKSGEAPEESVGKNGTKISDSTKDDNGTE